jgi:hypothetical protein
MNGHDRRAPFYRSEFAVRDDFALLRRLLAGEQGLVIGIPSGWAGSCRYLRLMDATRS